MLIGFDVRRSDSFGVGTYIHSLVQALVRRGPGHEYVLVGDPRQQSSFEGLPGNIRFLPYGKGYASLASHLRFQFLLRGLMPDIFHVPHRLVPYFMPCAYVVTVHDLDKIVFRQEFGSSLRAEARFHMLRHGLLRADRIISVSQATKRDLVHLMGAPADRIEIVPNAISEQFMACDSESACRETLERYQVDYPFLLYAGNIQPQKNLKRLVEAFAVVQAELEPHPLYNNLRLIIIGDDVAAHPDLRRAVIRSRMQQRVRFLGFVPAETLRIFYRSAAAFVFPSLYEGFGLPPLEAMAQGTPVVTSNVSSLPEVVGDAAVLVNPEKIFDIARGIREVLTNEGLRTTLCARGRARVERFSWDRTADRVLEIYREVVESRRASNGSRRTEIRRAS
jgi:glycosyltransferase involved in cell wall biosynthesis